MPTNSQDFMPAEAHSINAMSTSKEQDEVHSAAMLINNQHDAAADSPRVPHFGNPNNEEAAS